MKSANQADAATELTGAASMGPDHAVISVSSLLGTAREVVLLHDGVHYRLRITANNKLILTK